MKQTIIVIAVALIILGGGVGYVLMQRNTKAPAAADQTSRSSSTLNSTEAKNGLTIVFTNNGFDKASYTVKAGSVVTVRNESNTEVEFSSGPHPTHFEDPEINMKVLGPGESGTFTPTTKGSHSFHDHIHDQYTGTLIVD